MADRLQRGPRRPESGSLIAAARTDDLTDEFIDIADEIDASLIVIGLRRRSQVGKFILGSHSQRILLQADRPVLAVKADAATF